MKENKELSPEKPQIPAPISSRGKQKTIKTSETGPKTSAKTISISSGPRNRNELRSGHKETMDVESDGQRCNFSNLNKIYFPEPGVKKRELLAYSPHGALHPAVFKGSPDGPAPLSRRR